MDVRCLILKFYVENDHHFHQIRKWCVEQMSLQCGIGESTVRDIFKQNDKLVQFASTSDNSSMKKRKTMKTSTYEELDVALLEWVSQVRSEGTPISGPIVAAKAKQFFEMLGRCV